jgi:hypothetical protein
MAKPFEEHFAYRADSALNQHHSDEEEISRLQTDRL